MSTDDYTAIPRAKRKFRLIPISAFIKPLAKRLIIGAYCRGWLSKDRTQELFRKLDLGDC